MNTTQSDLEPIRTYLLQGVLRFVVNAIGMKGISRIALMGSILTSKKNPKDIDLIVTIDSDTILTGLEKLARKLKDYAQKREHSADIFLCSPDGKYFGKPSPTKDSVPWFESNRDKDTSGKWHDLHEDLAGVTRVNELVLNPPLVLWPEVSYAESPPSDVRRVLLNPLEKLLGK